MSEMALELIQQLGESIQDTNTSLEKSNVNIQKMFECLRDITKNTEENTIDIKKLEQKVEEVIPKIEGFERFINSKVPLAIELVAKILDYENLGRNNLFSLLEEKDILFSKIEYKRKNYRARQTYVGQGYFKVNAGINIMESKETGKTYEQPWTQVKVTPKGIAWLDKKIKEWGYKRNGQIDSPIPEDYQGGFIKYIR